MMANHFTDPLFQLVHTLEKAEKRNFKLYIKRNSAKENLKIIRLFDNLVKMSDYDEKVLMKKMSLSSTQKPQLANLKTHLYKQILSSLRLLKSTESIDLQLHEQLDYARILYNKGLFVQSLKLLERVKELTLSCNQDTFLIQVISMEKKIETLHISNNMHDRVAKITEEANEANLRRKWITQLSNLSLSMYSQYIRHGHARNTEEENKVKSFFYENMPLNCQHLSGFYEQLYINQSFCWYASIRQDYLTYYRYCQKWVELFNANPIMITTETGHYIKGYFNLLNALYDVGNYQKFEITLKQFEEFSRSTLANSQENFRIHTFVYINSAKLNQHLMIGSFAEGVKLIPLIEQKLAEFEYAQYIDQHRILVFNYKIALLYFGNGNFGKSIDYLQKILNDPVDMRTDLQCYARILHIIAHYELGNTKILDYLYKSAYRFTKKDNRINAAEQIMFSFLKNLINANPDEEKEVYENFINKIKKTDKRKIEAKAFIHIDLITWAESKLKRKSLSMILKEKYINRKNRHYKEAQQNH